MDEEKELKFKVTDRRKFNPDGSPREQTEEADVTVSAATGGVESGTVGAESAGDAVSVPGEAKEEKSAAEPQSSAGTETKSAPRAEASARGAVAQETADAAERAYDQTNRGKASRLPKASFLGLVNMLAVEAAMHLGLIETPAGEEVPLDMEAARHLIDMLGLIQEKTHGNLTAEEATILDNALAQLRMQFVAISRRQ
ncbi:MAG: DUF1844 domain-containing protein [Blastocatellia bacterium]|nr:DUF1844 domain-containing protein [Blastocatellia bacterium]